MTMREFTLALAHKACLLVRCSGSQRRLIMAIARGTALHISPVLSIHMQPQKFSLGQGRGLDKSSTHCANQRIDVCILCDHVKASGHGSLPIISGHGKQT